MSVVLLAPRPVESGGVLPQVQVRSRPGDDSHTSAQRPARPTLTRVAAHEPLSRFHSLTVASDEAVIKNPRSSHTTKSFTQSVCPW